MNIRIASVVVYSLLGIATLALPVSARAADADKGWEKLLRDDNLSLDWDTKGNWSIKDGVATLTPREGEKGWSRWASYLWSKKEYKDF